MVVLGLALAACNRGAAPQTFDGATATDPAALIRHGERLTHVLGCTGCHDVKLQGTFLTKDEPRYGPLYASNLSVELRQYTDAQIDGMIRHGVHPERKTLWGMPSEIFQRLSDPDQKALTAFLRSLQPIGSKLPAPQFSKLDKEEIATGKFKPTVKLVEETASQLPVDLGPQVALGRYITEVTCAECHGAKLEGNPRAAMGKIPNLTVAGGYTRAEFERLMTSRRRRRQSEYQPDHGGRRAHPLFTFDVARTRCALLLSKGASRAGITAQLNVSPPPRWIPSIF